jgi:hypothetical protein
MMRKEKIQVCDEPANFLKDSSTSLKEKTTEGKGVGARSLAHNTFEVKRAC